jgi:alpha-methylacyl-CoA racemase
VFAGTDACVAAVLALHEVPDHPHLAARSTLVEHDGVRQPSPAPRFSRTAPKVPSLKPVDVDAATILAEWST